MAMDDVIRVIGTPRPLLITGANGLINLRDVLRTVRDMVEVTMIFLIPEFFLSFDIKVYLFY